MIRLLLTTVMFLSALCSYAQSNIVVVNNNPELVYEEGEVLTFNISVTNTGPQPATNVVVSYPIPPGLNIPIPNLPIIPPVIKFWWSGTNNSQGSNVPLNNTIPSLGVNQTVTYTINIRINNNYSAGDLPLPTVTWNDASIVVTNTNNQTVYTPGGQAVYNVTVTNMGPNTANNVVVTNAIPAGITNFSWTGSNGSSGTSGLNNNVGTLAAGDAVTYTITAQIPANYAGNLVSSAGVTGNNVNVNCAQCTDTDTPPDQTANIVVTNTNNNTVFVPGQSYTYLFTVTNNGPNDAHNVTVTSNFVAQGISQIAWSGNMTDNGATNTDINNVISVLPVGSSVTYTATIQVPPTYTSPTLTSAVTASDVTNASPTPVVVTATDTDNIATGNNILVNTTSNRQFYNPGPGNFAVYTVTVNNTSTVAAENVQVNFGFDPVSTGVNFSWVGSNAAAGNFAGTGSTQIDLIPVLAAGQTITYTITTGMWPDAFSQDITANTNVVLLPGDPGDPAFTVMCNVCTDIDVPNLADLNVSITDNDDMYTLGGTQYYTLTVSNDGPAPAQGVLVSNLLPAGVNVSAWQGSNGTSGTGALAQTIPTIGVGEFVVYTITAQVLSTFTGDLVSTASAAGTTTDPDPTCAACTDTDVPPTANIVMTQTLNSGSTYIAGANAVYTITVTNQGPGDASNVSIANILPAGIDPLNVFWTGNNGSSGDGAINNVIPILGAGNSVVYQLVVPVPSNFSVTQNLVNEISITSPTPDPDPSCTQCTHTATPNPQANLVTLKTNGQTTYLSNEQVVYTITITNAGPSDAHNINVYDAKPYGIDVMTWSGNDDGGSGNLSDVITLLPAGETIQYTVTIFVPQDYHVGVGALTNQVSVTSNTTPDPVPGCPGCTDTDQPRSPNFITVTQHEYTVQELVTDVLIDTECVGISNITFSTGTNFGSANGIGYFHANNSSFPLKSGIVLTSADALQVPGPNLTVLNGGGGWPGDPDLEQFIPADENSLGATFIKFNFTPVSNTMSFRFMFASEEYGTPSFECQFSDVFAFILTNLSTGVSTNLAFLEGVTPPTPIRVTTVHLANGFCAAINPTFFGQYNNGGAAALAPINLNGQMKVMTASSVVSPNVPYSIKLVIANEGDNSLSSAVFLEAGSFDIGQPELPEDLSFSNGSAVCPNQTADITVDVGPQFNLQWLHNDVVMLDANGNPLDTPTITVSEPGVYTVLASVPNNPDCALSDKIVVEYIPEIDVNEPEDIEVCSTPGSDEPVPVNLKQVEAAMLVGLPDPFAYEFAYYTSMQDILDQEPSIWPPTTYPADIGTQTIFVQITDASSVCYTVKQFDLNVIQTPVVDELPDVEICGSYILPALTEGNYFTGPNGTGTSMAAGDVISADTTLYIYKANASTINPGFICTDEHVFTIEITEPPVLEDADDIIVCDDNYDGLLTIDLADAVAQVIGGNVGLSASVHLTQADANAGTAPQSVSAFNATTQIVYVRAWVTGSFSCYDVKPVSITVNPKPTVVAASDYELCDDNTDGIATFDLTTKAGEITNGNNDLVVSYYLSQNDAALETGAIADPTIFTNTTANTQIIWARVENIDTECFETTSFNVVVNPLPAIDASVDYAECEDAVGSGQGVFDLTSQDAIITQGSAEYVVTYYTTLIQAQNEDTAGLLDGTYTGPSATVIARVANQATGCVNYGELNLQVVPVPVPGTATPLEVCDNEAFPLNIYVGTFNLTPAINEIINGQGDVTATVHESFDEADTNTNAVINITEYSNVTDPDGFQTLYVRLERAGTDCYAIGMIELIVHPIPAIGVVTDYPLCDVNNPTDEVEVFDLTSKDIEVTNGVGGLTVTYHRSQQEAIADTNAIANPQAFQNETLGEQTIWIRLESAFGCFSTDSFQIIVNPLPVIDTNLEPFAACEETPGQALFNLPLVDALVTMGADGYNVSYYETMTGAETADPAALIASPYLSPEKTIFIRVENDQTGCVSTTSLELEVLPAPIAPVLAPLEVCDDNNDNVAIFNMTETINDIINALGTVTVTVHETEEDATFGTNPILNTAAYSNVQSETTGGVQVVYIRVMSGTTPCFDIAPLQLIVRPIPEATTPENYHVCDDNNDGIAVFNLSTKNAEVLNTMDPAQFTVEYYTSLAAAQAGVAPITNPLTFASPTATIYVRVENNATGCFDIVPLELIVNPLPVATQPTPYSLCDVNAPGDEKEVFDLTTKITEIIGAQEGINVTFHQTMADAQSGANAEGNPTAYINNETVETLFVRVEVEATGCFRVVLLDVRVEPLPVLTLPETGDLTVCDDDTNGIATFDLNAIAQVLLNDGQNITLAFYETIQNAQDEMFPIPNTDNYTNVVAFEQTLYVVATNTLTGCKSNPFLITIVVTPSPVNPNTLDALPDLVACDEDNQNQNGQTVIDLTQQNAVIIAALNVDPATLTIHYFTSEANAQAGAPRITSPSTFVGSDNQPIWVRIEDNNSECYNIIMFRLQIGTPLLLTTPPMFTVCDSDLPQAGVTPSEVFDLTTQNNTILGPAGVGQGYTVEYYLNQADALNNENAIANPETFTNTSAVQTLFVAVTTTEGCRSYTTLTLKVLPLPTPDTTPTPLQLCDDNDSPDGEERFDLTLAEADIRDNDNTTTITYHVTRDDAEQDINAIPDPSDHLSATATIYVRVEANTNNPLDPKCYQIVELELIVNPLPALGNNGVIPPYAICEPVTDGFAIFNLNTHNDEVIAGGDTTGYTFRYFRSEADAQANFNAIPLEGWQNEVATQQTIWVKVTNNATGCMIISSFDIFVELEAIANEVDDDLICDQTDGNNDGIANYDLTQLSPAVLGGQDPVQYIVEYYTEDPQANPDATPIADPANFRNEGSPDMVDIYIRVYNDATISKCSDYTSMTIFVERLPEPTLTGGTICVDYKTGEVIRTHTLDTGLDTTHTFQWFYNGAIIAGATENVYEAEAAGTYTVIATSENGCISMPIDPVTVLQSGPPSLIGAGYTVSNYFNDEQVITINVEGYGTYEYKLDEGPWQESNVFTNVSAGPHQVQVRDASAENPCSEFILTIEGVSTVDYPKYFTPNGDGYHDTWNITGFGDDNADAKIYIFDRYGKLVKQISSQGEGWDGTMNGMPMTATDYWFKAIYRETVNGVETIKEFKAHFSLKR